MPRRARQYIPQLPCHIVQGGNNREREYRARELSIHLEYSVKHQAVAYSY